MTKVAIVEKFAGFAKSLPRHEETGLIQNFFHANEKKYYIITENDSFPLSRWGYFRKFAFQFMASVDFSGAYNNWAKMLQLCDEFAVSKSGYTELILHCRSAMEKTKELSEMRYDAALYIATLFIIREDESILEWSQAQADEKIEDWIKEGYGIEDFFLWSANFLDSYLNQLTLLIEQMATGVAEKAKAE